MKLMSSEKCIGLLNEYDDIIRDNRAKLQVILEYFDEIACDPGERNFIDFGAFSRGLALICGEVIDALSDCEFERIIDSVKLFSPDSQKIKNYVADLKSIGIDDANIEFEASQLLR
jgi:hypothetical protein